MAQAIRAQRAHAQQETSRALADSLSKFGWTIPVLAREDGMIIAGHGRVEVWTWACHL
jgi:ParB-like chromosome segregation protein Spo0J